MLEALLTEIDPLPYRERRKVLAERARQLGADALADLWAQAGSRFERELVLSLAVIARDVATVEKGLAAAAFPLQAQALAACKAVPVPDELLEQAWQSGSAALRRRIAAKLPALRRPALARRLFEQALMDEAEAARLLPGCPAELVEARLPELEHAVPNWRILTRRHPGPVLALVQREFAAALPAERTRLWSSRHLAVEVLAEVAAEAVFELFERYAEQSSGQALHRVAPVLGKADPGRLLRLLELPQLREQGRQVLTGRLMRRMRALDEATLAGYGRLCLAPGAGWAVLVAGLEPSRRELLFELLRAGMSDAEPISTELLDALPRWARESWARKALALDRVRQDPVATLRYTAYLPFPEAQSTLEGAARRHAAEDRAQGYELLVRCAARSRESAHVGAALAFLRRLRNEQDPVRTRALGALAKVPASLFAGAHAEALEQVAVDAVAARDLSLSTRHALGSLVVALLRRIDEPALTGWATSTLDRLYAAGRIPLYLGGEGLALRQGQEHEFFAAVREWIVRGVRRAGFEPLFTTARLLGRRGWGVPELQELLGRATGQGNVVSVVTQAIELWLEDPRTRSDRAGELVRQEPSSITLDPVWRVAQRQRTDLLDVVLRPQPLVGRHVAEGVRWVPLHPSPVERWLPRQQRSYAELLRQVAADGGTPMRQRTAAIKLVAAIPGAGFEIVTPYLASPEVELVEAALAALPATDRLPEALRVLTGHVDDDRARVASYAVGHIARLLPAAELTSIVDGPLRRARKITSRKEFIRLLGAYGGPAATQSLMDAWRQPDQHRDVRVALVHAAQQRLGQEPMWELLTEAAGMAEPAVLEAVLRPRPAQFAARYRARYAALVAAACRSEDEIVVRTALYAYPSWARWAPDGIALARAACVDLSLRLRWHAGQGALISLLEEGFGVDELRPAVLALADQDDPELQPERDLPSRQRLGHFLDFLTRWIWRRRQDDLSALHDLALELATRPQWLLDAIPLLVSTVDWRAPEAQLTRLATLAASRPLATARLADQASTHVKGWITDLPALHAAAAALAIRLDQGSGLLATALVDGAVDRRGWDAGGLDWRSLLRILRAHPDLEVRVAARHLFTTAE